MPRHDSLSMRFFSTLLNATEKLLQWLIAVLMLLLLGIVLAMLVDRHFITLPIAAPDQYARIALVWICFIGFALAVRAGVTIRVDMIDARLPAFWRNALAACFDVILLILVALLLVKSWPVVQIGIDQLLLGTDIPAAVPSASLLVACALMVVILIGRVVRRMRGETFEFSSHHDSEPGM